MTIQASIIEALRASQSAHEAALAEVKALRAEKAALDTKVAGLEARISALQAEAVKIVEPSAVQPLLDELARAVAATHAAVGQTAPDGHEMTHPGPEVTEQRSEAAPIH